MISNHVAFKLNFLIALIITEFTSKGFFSCMRHDMPFHVSGIFHYFFTVKTPILSCTKFYWRNLQNNQETTYLKWAIYFNEDFLLQRNSMIFVHMVFELKIKWTFVFAKVARERFFSSMCHNMPLHISGMLHYLYTEWASKLPCAKLYWTTLQIIKTKGHSKSTTNFQKSDISMYLIL